MKKNSNRFAFSKYTGTGNDFLIVDLRKTKQTLSRQKRKLIARKACDRHFGVGADGILFLEKSKNKKNKFAWDFYNQDGSLAEMCLNASRCVTLYEFHQTGKKKTSFESRIGVIEGRVLSSSQVEVKIPLTKKSQGEKVSVHIKEKIVRGYLVNSGVPHFVINKNKFSTANEKQLGSKLRKYLGANVTFWESLNKKGDLRAATFERGVEDFTLSCGTGAAAVGLMFNDLAHQAQTQVQMPGGKLSIYVFTDKLQIRGQAKKILTAQLNLQDIL